MTPRLGFLGVGWIGRNRLDAIAASGVATVAAVSDVSEAAAASVAETYGATVLAPEELLAGAGGLGGVVVATPSALHAEQATAALRNGLAVFCQKPLARTAAESEAVVEAARAADRLLGVDLSYRHVAGVPAMRELVASGALGEVYAADLVFHNAYGPDKPWFTDPALSGGGCVIDLGIHLVDLVLWLLDRPKVADVSARLFRQGRSLHPPLTDVVEDYAVARLDLASGAVVTLSCSWFLHAGEDAVIGATLYGSAGSVSLRNVAGSFYDFTVTRATGTAREVLAGPPDDWGGRAAVEWATRLAHGERFDPRAGELVEVAAVLDRIYGR